MGNTATSITAVSTQNELYLTSTGRGFGNDPDSANAAPIGVFCRRYIDYARPAGDCQQQLIDAIFPVFMGNFVGF